MAHPDEPIHSEVIDELDRIREKRLSQESKNSETDAAAVTRKDDLPPKRP